MAAKKQIAMYFIQEAYCTESDMHDWGAEWGYQALLAGALAKKQALSHCFTILLPFKFREHTSRFQVR